MQVLIATRAAWERFGVLFMEGWDPDRNDGEMPWA
jgi:hypothetical protein